MRVPAILFTASMFALVACGGDEPPAKSPESASSATATAMPTETPPTTAGSAEAPAASASAAAEASAPPPPPKKSAKDILTGGGTFMFSLADSADAKKASDDACAKKGGKNEKKVQACKDDAATAAAGEGVRFEKDDKGKWFWVSFGTEKGKEVIYNKVEFSIASDSDGKVTLTPAGKDMGKKPMKALPKEVVVEIPDESTVSMTDPKKGKLVYKKK
jgi:hypothetical protein